MFDWLAERRARHARDMVDARYLLQLHGEGALEAARSRIESSSPDGRSRKRWRRIERLVQKLRVEPQGR